MTTRTNRVVAGLIGTLLADAVFDAVGLYPVAQSTSWGDWTKQWIKDDLDRLQFPEQLRFVFPIIKTAATAGLVARHRWRPLGRFTAACLVLYFVLALGVHLRVRDTPARRAPAVVMFVWCVAVWRALVKHGR